jgi:hypothetical protein
VCMANGFDSALYINIYKCVCVCGMRMCVYAYICVSNCATRVCVVGSVHVGVFSTHLFHHYATHTHTHTHTHTGPTWHCIVGSSFGSGVIHEDKRFICFYIGRRCVLLFKAGFPRGMCVCVRERE